jgi:hypothetical protein
MYCELMKPTKACAAPMERRGKGEFVKPHIIAACAIAPMNPREATCRWPQKHGSATISG